MTLSTSAVAVCCWRRFAQLTLSSRVFSMAMTACAAKFCNQLDLFVRERPHFLTIHGDSADKIVFLEHRHGKKRRTRRPRLGYAFFWY